MSLYMCVYISLNIYPHTTIHVVPIPQVAAREKSIVPPESYFPRSLFYSVAFTHTHT